MPRSTAQVSSLQLYLPSIFGDLPAGSTHLGALWAVWIKDRIRIVDMQKNLARATKASEFVQAALRGRERDVSHLARGVSAALHLNQLIITPEGAVEEHKIGGVEALEQSIVNLWDCGHKGHPFARWRFDDQSQEGLAGDKLGGAFFRNIGGVASIEGKRFAGQTRGNGPD